MYYCILHDKDILYILLVVLILYGDVNLTFCLLGNLSHAFLLSSDFFRNHLFRKILSGLLSRFQTVWIQITVLGPNCLQRLSGDVT